MTECWWAKCRIDVRPAGKHECEGCPALMERDEGDDELPPHCPHSEPQGR